MDLLLDDTGDLAIANGDFVLGDDLNQRVWLLVETAPGTWKQNPLSGYGAKRLLGGPFDGKERRGVQLALEADGIRLSNFQYQDGKLYITGQ